MRPILYGVADYALLRKKNGWFIDRTAKIRFSEPTKAVLQDHKVTLVVLRGEDCWIPRPHRGRKA